MKKSTIAIISVLLTLSVCLGIFFIADYSAKRNGRTIESRELILQEKYDADFLICERKIDGIIFSAFERLDGRDGVAVFREKNGKYSTGRTKYSDSDLPNVEMMVLNEKFSYIIFLNQPNMDYVEVTFEVTTYAGTREDVTFKYDVTDDPIVCAESPQAGQPKRIVYTDKKGQKHSFVEDDKTREYYVKES